MKKRVLAIVMSLVFLVSTMSAYASPLKDIMGDLGISEGSVITVSVDADLSSKMSADSTFANDTLTVTRGDSVDFQAYVDMTKVKEAYNTVKTVAMEKAATSEDQAALEAEFAACTVAGQFTITVDYPQEQYYVMPQDHVSENGASLNMYGFSTASGDLNALYEETSRIWDTANGTLTMVVSVRDGVTPAVIEANMDDLYYTLNGVTIGETGTFTTKLAITGSTDVYSGEEKLGTIVYNFKQYDTQSETMGPDPDGTEGEISVTTTSGLENVTATFTAPDGVEGTIDPMTVAMNEWITLPSSGMTKTTSVGSYSLSGWQRVSDSRTFDLGAQVQLSENTEFIPLFTYTEGTGNIKATDAVYFSRLGAAKRLTSSDVSGSTITYNGISEELFLWGVDYDTSDGSTLYTEDSNRTAIYAKFDISTLEDPTYVALSLLHSRQNTGSSNTYTIDVIDVEDYDTAFANVTTEAIEFAKENLPVATTNAYSGTLPAEYEGAMGRRITKAITTAVKEAIANDQDYIVLKIAVKRNYTTSSKDGCIKTYSFMTGSYLTCTTIDEVTASFVDDNGSSVTDSVTTTPFASITLPAGPEKEGYFFQGWYCADDGETYAESASYALSDANVSFKAIYTKGVTLTLKDCDNEGSTLYMPSTEITLETPTRTTTVGSYTFTGWTDGTETYAAGTPITLNDNMTLTAMWTYTGGEGNINWVDSYYFAVTNYETYTTSDNKTAYRLTDDGSTGVLYRNPTGQRNLFRKLGTSAYFAKIDLRNVESVTSATLNVIHNKFNNTVTAAVYDIDVDAYDAAFTDATSGATFNTADLPTGTLIASGTFAGNSTTPNPAVIDITEYLANKVASGVDFVCIRLQNNGSGNGAIDAWRVNNFSTASYISLNTSDAVNAYFDNGVETITSSVGNNITLPEMTTQQRNKVFTGWTADGGTTVLEAGSSYTLSSNVTFTSVWVDGFDVDYVTDTTSYYETYVADSVITLPEANDKDGYTFEGWTTDGGATIIDAGTEQTITADVKYTAVYWKRLNYTDWYLYYGGTQQVTNFNQSSHTLGRNDGSKLFTTLDISEVDTDAYKATFYFQYSNMKNGYTYLNIYPVEGNYDTVFAGIEWNTTSADVVDISGLTFGTRIGITGKEAGGPYNKTDAYVTLEYTLPNLATYIENQRVAGSTSVQLGYQLTSGDATNDGLRMYNTSTYPAYIRLYVLAGAETITPATPAE